MLLINNIEITIVARNLKYIESKGYEVPKHIYKGKLVASIGEKIVIKTKDLPNGSNIRVKCRCDYCNEEYSIKYSHYVNTNHNGKTYCKKCAHTVLTSGRNHCNWKDDKTPEEREKGRCYPEYTQFIKRVMERDKHICQCCGKHIKRDGVVHHLNGYNWCKEQRTDDTNGITLCGKCHGNFHSIYGKGNNTREQFEEWIGHTVELLKYENELCTSKKIFCVEENKIYNSATDFAKTYNIKNNSDVYRVCNHEVKTRTQRRKLHDGTIKEYTWQQRYKTIKGKHIYWLDEYIKINSKA